MVIVRLIGGLCNQLFQYAAALQIAYSNDVPLKLDVSAFKSYDLHGYSLKHFNITEEFTSSQEVDRFKRATPTKLLVRLLQRLGPYNRRSWIRERHFHFDPAILNVSGDVYLEGYWQSEQYFKEIEPLLRQEFTVKTSPDAKNAEMAEQIQSVPSVSVHVRRGDYASNPITQGVLGLCPLEYYYEAVRILSETLPELHLFVFSDDPQWADQNLEFDYPTTFVAHNNADKNFEDLRLMSLCRHHIIA